MRGLGVSAGWVLTLSLAILSCGGGEPGSEAGPSVFPGNPPNILFISVDDLNDWIEPLGGHPQARTPNLNRLAERGVLFERAYTPSPSCNPARTALTRKCPAIPPPTVSKATFKEYVNNEANDGRCA